MRRYKIFRGRLVLIDMDNTLNRFDDRFTAIGMQIVPKAFETRKIKEYWIEDSFQAKYHDALHAILCEKDFFSHIEPMPEALQAIHEMEAAGLKVVICSAPHPGSEFCEQEKRDWLRKHLGEKFAEEAYIERDKTTVPGDVLIDDHPKIMGRVAKPYWTQILFNAPYNEHIDTQFRMNNWNEWPSMIEKVLKSPR